MRSPPFEGCIMFDWRPNKAVALVERQHLAELLRTELIELAEKSGATHDAVELLAEGPLSGLGVLHPDCFDLRNVVERLGRQGRAPRAEVLVAALEQTGRAIAASRLRAAENRATLGGGFDTSPDFLRGLGIMKKAVLTKWPERTNEAELVRLRPAARDRLKTAFDILRTAW